MGILQSLLRALGLDPNERQLKIYKKRVEEVNALESDVSCLTDEEIKGSAAKYKEMIENGSSLDDILPEVFARVREISKRRLGMRHFDVQLIGGMVLNDNKIAEMKTGEGKTLVATLAVVLNAMSGKGVHVITVNDYLARRDAEWMSPVYEGMGLTVGIISPFMDNEERKAAYQADITYGTNSEFGFDYLRDNMCMSLDEQVQRGHNFCIVDEVDSILIDEARTPLIISGPSEDNIELYKAADSVARSLKRDEDFEIDEKERNVALTEEGIDKCETSLKMPDLFTDYGSSELAHKIIQSLKAHWLFKKDIHYVVKDGEIVIVDEFTGRLMVGRRYSEGLHQAIEAKEHVAIGRENQTLATITLQNYFRMYTKLSGMTGTALTEAEEFKDIYGLDVVSIPTHLPMIRHDNPDVIYRTKTEKFSAAADEIEERWKTGQPVLVGTSSIENSERMSKLLKARKIPHNVLNAKVHDKEAAVVAQAGRLGAVTVATNMAGRGTDIVLGGNAEFLALDEAAQRGVEFDSPEYKEIFDELSQKCREEHDKVIELGGLSIIGIERHESRRIDNQLRGRAGRQGDPGVSRFYVALDDDLLRLFGGEKVDAIMQKLGMAEGEALESGMLSRVIEGAQKKIESMHFDIRKMLLSYDNVMNMQREAVYRERTRILEGDDILDRIRGVIADAADAALDSMKDADPEEFEEARHASSVKLRALFGDEIESIAEGVESSEGLDDAAEEIKSVLDSRFDKKVEDIGSERAGVLFRFILLQAMDAGWREHLLGMDELRRGIGLRAVGQKDPRLEYQFESQTLFEEMLQDVREKVAGIVLRIEAVSERPSVPLHILPPPPSRELLFSSAANESAASQQRARASKKHEKIGRNDPCPCGSGKKYKHCCGKNLAVKSDSER